MTSGSAGAKLSCLMVVRQFADLRKGELRRWPFLISQGQLLLLISGQAQPFLVRMLKVIDIYINAMYFFALASHLPMSLFCFFQLSFCDVSFEFSLILSFFFLFFFLFLSTFLSLSPPICSFYFSFSSLFRSTLLLSFNFDFPPTLLHQPLPSCPNSLSSLNPSYFLLASPPTDRLHP